MISVHDAADRFRLLRRDALLTELAVLVCGLVFLLAVSLVGDPGWYAFAWAAILALTLFSPYVGNALLPAGIVVWWFSGIPVGSSASLPAALSLLGILTGTALLLAVPDGVAFPRAVVMRYLQRALVVAALTTGVWAVGLVLMQARISSVLVTAAAFLGLAVALVALPRLMSLPGRDERSGRPEP